MLSSARPARGAVMGAIGAGALAGAMLFGAAATAGAQPPPPVPPPCTAAELARVMSGVAFDTSIGEVNRDLRFVIYVIYG